MSSRKQNPSKSRKRSYADGGVVEDGRPYSTNVEDRRGRTPSSLDYLEARLQSGAADAGSYIRDRLMDVVSRPPAARGSLPDQLGYNEIPTYQQGGPVHPRNYGAVGGPPTRGDGSLAKPAKSGHTSQTAHRKER